MGIEALRWLKKRDALQAPNEERGNRGKGKGRERGKGAAEETPEELPIATVTKSPIRVDFPQSTVRVGLAAPPDTPLFVVSRPVRYHAPSQQRTRPRPRRYRSSACDGDVGARRTSERCALRAQRLAQRCTCPKNAALCETERCKGTGNGIGTDSAAALPPRERVTTRVLCECETQAE